MIFQGPPTSDQESPTTKRPILFTTKRPILFTYILLLLKVYTSFSTLYYLYSSPLFFIYIFLLLCLPFGCLPSFWFPWISFWGLFPLLISSSCLCPPNWRHHTKHSHHHWIKTLFLKLMRIIFSLTFHTMRIFQSQFLNLFLSILLQFLLQFLIRYQ